MEELTLTCSWKSSKPLRLKVLPPGEEINESFNDVNFEDVIEVMESSSWRPEFILENPLHRATNLYFLLTKVRMAEIFDPSSAGEYLGTERAEEVFDEMDTRVLALKIPTQKRSKILIRLILEPKECPFYIIDIQAETSSVHKSPPAASNFDMSEVNRLLGNNNTALSQNALDFKSMLENFQNQTNMPSPLPMTSLPPIGSCGCSAKLKELERKIMIRLEDMEKKNDEKLNQILEQLSKNSKS